MSRLGLKNLKSTLLKSKLPVDTRKILAWAMVLNIAELKVLTCLFIDDEEGGINSGEIADFTGLNILVVAYCLDSLSDKNAVKRIPKKYKNRGRPKKVRIQKKEHEYKNPLNRYTAELRTCPFPEEMMGIRT